MITGSIVIINGFYVRIRAGQPNQVMAPVPALGPSTGLVRSISQISETGLVSFSDGTQQQLKLPSGKGISGISAAGLITFSDGTQQQLNLSGGGGGVNIAGIGQPTPGVMRVTLTNGDATDVPLPASTVPGPPPTVRTFQAGVAAAIGNLTNYAGALYPVTVAHTYGSAFDPSKHGPAVAAPGPASTVPGPKGDPPTIVPFVQGTSVAVGNLTNYGNALYPVTVAHTYGPAFDASKHGAPVAVPGQAGRGITVSQPNANTLRFAYTDGTPSVDIALPAAAAAVVAGLVDSATTLDKGCVYYWSGSTWAKLVPGRHRLALNTMVAMVDQDGNLIKSGNLVRVAGLGFVSGQSYYVETPDGSGRNVVPLANPVPSALNASNTRSFFKVGSAVDTGSGMTLDFNFELTVLDTSPIPLDLATYSLGAVPSPSQIARILDAAGGNPDGPFSYGVFADGDANTGSGWAASPVVGQVGGVSKGLFLSQYGFGGRHAGYLAQVPALQVFDALMLFQASDNIVAGGFLWGWDGTSYNAVRMDGPPDYLNFEKVTRTGTNSYSSAALGTIAGASMQPSGIGNKTLGFLRVNVSTANGVSVLKVKAWKYDTTKGLTPAGLLQQGANEPGWTVNYTHSALFAAGRLGYHFAQNYFHVHTLNISPDPSVPAPFGVS